MKSALLDEIGFDIDSFNQPLTNSGLFALAQRVNSLMLMNPNTMPDCPEMGERLQNTDKTHSKR